MSNVEIVLDTEGIRQLRHAPEIEEALTEVAQGIKAKCSGNYEVSAPFQGKYHSNVEVVTADNATYYRNLHNNELLKAMR